MLAQLRSSLTYANVMATLAVFIALGGSAYAVTKLDGENIKDKSISGKKLKTRTIAKGKIKKSTITGVEVSDRSLLANDFKAGQLPAGRTGPRGPSNGYFVHSDNNDHSLSLPAGNYLAYSTANLVPIDDGAITTCTLTVGSASQSVSAFGGGVFTASVGAKLTGPGSASMSCTNGLAYGANISAIKVASLD